LFQVTLTRITSGGVSYVQKVYFNNSAKKGSISPMLAFIVALLLSIFGLTITISRITFSWFGIVVMIACIGVLTFATPTWYITLLEVIDIIILVFIVIILSKQTYPVVSG
jgi:hypothetical protein